MTKNVSIISLFSGAMGFDLGFEQEGFEIKVCIEKSKSAANTIKANRPDIKVINLPLEMLSTSEILETAGISHDEPTIIIGAPPCEPFSTAGRRGSLEDNRTIALIEFIRVIREARPVFFAFEEVPAIISAAQKHISFYERISKQDDELKPEEKLGSAFKEIVRQFRETGYHLTLDPENPKGSICNSADFGVPQKRKRFIVIGSRDGLDVKLPSPDHAKPDSAEALSGKLPPWLTLRDALTGLNEPNPECMKFSPIWSGFLPKIPPGGCWRSLPLELQKKVLGGAYDNHDDPKTSGKKGGRTGFLRRLSWNEPSPTLVDHPTTKAACLCHPDENRPLSVREYGRIQGFPDDWVFCGRTSSKYRLIGQATPVRLSRAVAHSIRMLVEHKTTRRVRY